MRLTHLLRIASIALLFGGCCAAPSIAQTYAITTSYTDAGRPVTERATAVCVGNSPGGRSLLLTVKHAVSPQDAVVSIAHNGDWIRATRIVKHPTADLAAIECQGQLPGVEFADSTPIGEQVTVAGFGPAYAHTNDGLRFTGTIDDTDTLRGDDGNHAMPGDSGGPVLCQANGKAALVGIVRYHDGGTPAASRRTYASTRARTGFVPAETIADFVQTQYPGGCPNGLCPIQIRPRVIQPVGPLGFPRGPARVVGIAEPVPQTYHPIVPTPDPISMRCPAGPPGPAGPQGPPGRSVNRAEVEACVNAWLDSNIDRIRGEPGEPGPAGRDGASGDPAELAQVIERLTAMERRPFRLVLSSNGKTLDDETYAPGEPVVLDLKRLRSVSGGK